MAVAFVQAVGTAQSKTAGTSLATSTSLSVTAGNDIFVSFASDDVGTAHAVSDNLGNTYSLVKAQQNAANVKTQLWRKAGIAGGTLTAITVSWTTNVTAKAMVAGEYSGVGTLVGTDGASASGSLLNIVDAATVAWQSGDLVIGASGHEDSNTNPNVGSVGTTIPAPTTVGYLGTTGAGAASNITAGLGHAIATATGGGTDALNMNYPADAAVAGAVYNAAASGTTTAQAMTATAVVLSASIVRIVNKRVTATNVAVTASMARSVAKYLTATTTNVTASIIKQVNKSLTAASVNVTASLAALKVFIVNMTATAVTVTASLAKTVTKVQAMTATTVAVTATITKSVAKTLTAASVALSASIIKNVGKTISATVTSSATLSAIRVFIVNLTATVTSTASMVKSVGKTVSATASATATVVKSIGKTISATSTVSASMSALRAFLLTMTATVTASASMVRSVGKTVSATVTGTASVTKQVAIRLTATVTTTASMVASFVAGAAVALYRMLMGLGK